MGSWQFTVVPTGQRRNGFWLIASYKHLLAVLIGQPPVADAVAVGGRDAGRTVRLSRGARPIRSPWPSARLSPAPGAPLPRPGSATEMPEWGGAGRTAPKVRQRNGIRRMVVVGRRNTPRRVTPGESPGEEMGEACSPADGYVARRRAGAICVAMASVQSVAAAGPERVEPAVKLLSVQQLPRSRDEAAGAGNSLQPQGEEIAERVSRFAGEREGLRTQGHCAGFGRTSCQSDCPGANGCRGKGVRDAVCSGCHLRESVRGVGIPRLGLGFLARARCASKGNGSPAADEGNVTQSWQHSLAGAPGRRASILAEQARAIRDHAPRFLWQWKPW